MRNQALGVVTIRSPNQARFFGAQDTLFQEMCAAWSEYNSKLRIIELNLDCDEAPEKKYELHHGVWEEVAEDLPSSLYDRVFPAESAQRKRYCQWLAEAAAKHLIFVNHHELPIFTADKLRTSEFFQRYGIRIPATTTIQNGENLLAFLKEYPKIILKPRWGRGGSGVIKIEVQSADRWRMSSPAIQSRLFSSAELALECDRLTNLDQERGPEWLAQNYIEFGSESRALELRMLLQRSNLKQEPTVLCVALVAAPDQWTTNLGKGGLAYPPVEALQLFRGLELKAALKLVTGLVGEARLIHALLERNYYPVGEITVDFLIDTDSRSWVIELNSKPGKIAFSRLAASDDFTLTKREIYHRLRRRVILNPLKFLQSSSMNRD